MHQIIVHSKGRSRSRSVFRSHTQPWLSIFLILLGLHLCSGLTSESRNELARKFKYYHRSIRPSDRLNLIDTINGTFFALHTEVELLQSRPNGNRLEMELMLSLHYNDDRLILRDLQDIITIPDEFFPWMPQLDFPDHTVHRSSIHVDPRTGQISLRHKLHVNDLKCESLEWTRPFQKYLCKFEIGTNGNEKIFPRTIRDLRTTTDIWLTTCFIEQFPTFVVACEYRNQWLAIIVNIYLPSILMFTTAVFSQWKRRRLQVLVTLGSLIGLIMLKTTKNRDSNFDMEDLWLLSTLMHLIALLGIDLVLPARRITRTTYSNMGEKLTSFAHSNHATFSNGSTEKAFTTSYKEATQRFLRPFPPPLSNRTFLGSSEERSVFLEPPPSNKPYDLSDIEMADEEADGDDLDLQRMRTTYIHIRKPVPNPNVQTVLGTSFTDTSPSINAVSQKTQQTSSVSSATPTAIIRKRTSGSPTDRSQRFVTKMTIGRKKRLALVSIIGCYLVFVVIYVFIVLYILG